MKDRQFDTFPSFLNFTSEVFHGQEDEPSGDSGDESSPGDPDPGLDSDASDSDSAPNRERSLDPDQCEICYRRSCRCKKTEAPAHAGRRRRRITEDLFRCKLPLVIKGQKIPCNALVWRRPDKMREHLCDHLSEEEIAKLDDNGLQIHYSTAARIAQEGIYDDEVDSAEDD